MVKIVEKGWGREIIFADSELYCGKLLVFDAEGSKCSMHFHDKKTETWYVQKGSFDVFVMDLNNTLVTYSVLREGETWTNYRLQPHQLRAREAGSTIIEVSTQDNSDDNYRIMPGDSQR